MSVLQHEACVRDVRVLFPQRIVTCAEASATAWPTIGYDKFSSGPCPKIVNRFRGHGVLSAFPNGTTTELHRDARNNHCEGT
jgi:hypothetical protein